MVKLLLAEKSDAEPKDELGENPLDGYSFHSPQNRARRREKISVMRGGHSRRT